ncbi:hypothetical protein COS91_04015 [Candidatus Desantisbacteria bacterium CG07_land_8_20_14_0_80_39_15]|uniref:Carbohydrate kinase PfkB domain-containing protein n=1 Tax=Candidatus Desantisbacteria bacterium CG07_land_8_20_14_0_80_39_15 TaxID=1974549 RepID=A0A2M6ZGH1_9BACT|nr:MAG: hypothetical protein COS91_04015 [Candidatus Desantisbacteria bacterium CG07_land_8_20_14_0_80_39_15]
MIATLTLNSSLDLSVRLGRIDYKDINRVREIQRDPGGKGINISRIIHRLKGETIALGFLGGWTGKKIKELLDDEGVPGDFVWTAGENRSNITIDLPEKAGQIKINEDGPRINKDEMGLLIRKISSLSYGDFLIMSGSVPRGVGEGIYFRMIRIAQRQGVKAVLDTDGEPLYLGLRAKPFLIKPNIYEAQRLLERIHNKPVRISTEADLLNAAHYLSKTGVEIVIISWGSRGIIVTSKGKFWRCRPPINSRVNSALPECLLSATTSRVNSATTSRVHSALPECLLSATTSIVHSATTRLKYTGVGAGDAVVAGFTYGLSRSERIENCIRWGIACGTAATLQKGTKLCKTKDVKRLLKKVKVT